MMLHDFSARRRLFTDELFRHELLLLFLSFSPSLPPSLAPPIATVLTREVQANVNAYTRTVFVPIQYRVHADH